MSSILDKNMFHNKQILEVLKPLVNSLLRFINVKGIEKEYIKQLSLPQKLRFLGGEHIDDCEVVILL